jgi:hypothetical protein
MNDNYNFEKVSINKPSQPIPFETNDRQLLGVGGIILIFLSYSQPTIFPSIL